MPVIYIREQRSVVRKRGGRILVEKEGQTLLEIPLRQTDSVALFGNVRVTTQALSELLDRGIPLALYTRNGRLKGHLTPELSRNVPLRLAQYKISQDAAQSFAIAQAIVCAKLLNSAELVADYRANYPSAELEQALDFLCAASENASKAPGRNELLGCEGSAAALYFRVFALMNRSDLPFDGREKYPPPDPVNALLSLGYTVVMNEIRALVEGAGLEPHIGFLHGVDYGRPSLALDLLEPFRSIVVDRLTLRLVNERILTAADFASRVSGPRAGSVILTPEAFTRYLGHYEAAVCESRKSAPGGMREVIRQEVDKLARALRTQTAFEPFLEVD